MRELSVAEQRYRAVFAVISRATTATGSLEIDGVGRRRPGGTGLAPLRIAPPIRLSSSAIPADPVWVRAIASSDVRTYDGTQLGQLDQTAIGGSVPACAGTT